MQKTGIEWTDPTFLVKDENEPLLPCLMRVIRAAASSDSVTPAARQRRWRDDAEWVRELEARLSRARS